MTDTTDNVGGREASTTPVAGTEGRQPILLPANDAPPPVTITDHVVGAFVGNANALAAFFQVAGADYEALEGFKATLAAMRNMPPDALGDVTIQIISGFFKHFEQDPTSVEGRQALAAFDSNIALAIQDAAQHIMQNMQAQAQARHDLTERLKHGHAGQR